MYVIEKLKLNRFKECYIPTPRELYEKLGYSAPKANGSSDNEFGDPVNLLQTSDKVTAIDIGSRLAKDEYYSRIQEEERMSAKRESNDSQDSE